MLNPKKGEFLKLEQKRKLLQNSRRITDTINQVVENFTREDPPGIDSLNFNKCLITKPNERPIRRKL